MQSLWRELETGWQLIGPEPELSAQLGPETFSALDRLGLIRRESFLAGVRLPCDGCSQGRQVVEHEGTWAVCTHPEMGCESVDLTEVDRAEIDEGELIRRLQTALQLEGPIEPLSARRPVLLGHRRLGGRRIAFGLVRPRRIQERIVREWLQLRRVQSAVLLAPTSQWLPDWVLPQGAHWLAMDQIVDLQAGRADLSELAFALRLSGAELAQLLWPRFHLVIDSQGTPYYGGVRVDLGRSAKVGQLLALLASRPGEWLSRRKLLTTLYPGEVTNRGRWLTDLGKLDRRLRQLVSALSKAFDAALLTNSTLENPVENLRARGDDEGGYRLRVPEGRVWCGAKG